MPPAKRQPFNLRQFLGVNRMINARVVAPGSWFQLKNLYMQPRGRLEQRPGTTEFASQIVVGTASPGDADYPDKPDDFPKPGFLDETMGGNYW